MVSGDEERGSDDLSDVHLACFFRKGSGKSFALMIPLMSFSPLPKTGYRENCSSSMIERTS